MHVPRVPLFIGGVPVCVMQRRWWLAAAGGFTGVLLVVLAIIQRPSVLSADHGTPSRAQLCPVAETVNDIFVPEFDCTLASGLCDCGANDGGRPPKILVRGTGVQSATRCLPQEHDSTTLVRVEVDSGSWLRAEMNLGYYSCKTSRCHVGASGTAPGDLLSDESRVFITATPTETTRRARHNYQRVALLSIESPGRYPHYTDATWLKTRGFTDVVSTTPVIGFPSWNISYVNADLSFFFTRPWPVSHKINGVAAFISHCDEHTRTRRLDLLVALNNSGIPVYSFGGCRRTHRVEDLFPECTLQSRRSPMWDFVKMCVLRRFRFTAAFENDARAGYITEKLFQPLAAGSVPLYAGAPDVRRVLPRDNAAIILDSFDDEGIRRMVQHTLELAHDDHKYEAALEWKLAQPDNLRQTFLDTVSQSWGSLACILCDQVARAVHSA